MKSVGIVSLGFFALASAAAVKRQAQAGGTPFQSSITTSDGRTRTYYTYLPQSYQEGTSSPLILSFHGNTETAQSQIDVDQLNNPDWNPNYIVVWPQGVNDSWEGAPYSTPGVSDKNFIGQLLDSLESQYNLDKSRIYATGKSNGGGFVNVLACSPSESGRFAAFAPVSGAFYEGNAADGSDCHPANSPQPIMEFHGLADTTIPYNGGERHGAQLPDILTWAELWAQRNGCPADDTVSPVDSHSGNVKHYTWDCNNSGGVTQHWAIEGLGHCWPSTQGNGDCGGATTYIDATPHIVSFFDQYSL